MTLTLFRGRIKQVNSTVALHSTLNILETIRERAYVPWTTCGEIKWSRNR